MRYAKPAKPAEAGKFYGHSPNRNGQGEWQLLIDHILGRTETQRDPGVAWRAREFAALFGEGDRAFLAGLLHDLGKYSPTFTRHLSGEHLKLDHWTAGAYTALMDYRDVAVALAIEGHHVGLQQGEKSTFRDRFDLRKPTLTQEKHLQLTELDDPEAMRLKSRWQQDLAAHGVECPKPQPRLLNQSSPTSEMLGVRMLFSTLVDADFLETENHFSEGREERASRPEDLDLQAEKALERVRVALDRLAADTKIPAALQALRRTLGENCVAAAHADDLLWTMTAPTGSGKTLAMLLFALERAAREPKRFRRIVIALPYLSILDQTAKIYHDLFPEDELGTHYVLEHHSLAGAPRAEDDPEEDEPGKDTRKTDDRTQAEARMLTENWDAPIVLTTNVQLFESLHANRPSACRKLHNLAGSIILCDEVQTLPTSLAVPTLRTLSALATPTYNTAVVFATATQPAFRALHDVVKEDVGTRGWEPREIVTDAPAMFAQAAKLRPIHVDWSPVAAPEGVPWATVAGWLTASPQGMAIVNLRRHSRDLAEILRASKVPGLEYISTYLCPRHRREVLARVNAALDRKNPKPCRLVATQCVEAGVDLDFPLVCRALAPLDAIAQASGRCNRNGLLGEAGGVLRVFRPQDDGRKLYPDDAYRQAAERTGGLAARPGGIRLTDPAEYDAYFRALYALNDVARKEGEVHQAINRLDFAETARHYRLIDKRGINVVVPYGEQGKAVWNEIDRLGLNRDRIRAAREFTVSVLIGEKQKPPSSLRPLTMTGNGAVAPDWFLLKMEDAALYDPTFGLSPEDGKGEPDEPSAPRGSSGYFV